MSLKKFAEHVARKMGKLEKEEEKLKYKNKPTDGYPSQLERAVHALLLWREKAGEIRNIKRQASVDLHYWRWKVDFSFEDVATGETIWCEAKGEETRDYLKNLKLWPDFGPGKLEIWKGTYQKPRLYKIILGKGKHEVI